MKKKANLMALCCMGAALILPARAQTAALPAEPPRREAPPLPPVSGAPASSTERGASDESAAAAGQLAAEQALLEQSLAMQQEFAAQYGALYRSRSFWQTAALCEGCAIAAAVLAGAFVLKVCR